MASTDRELPRAVGARAAGWRLKRLAAEGARNAGLTTLLVLTFAPFLLALVTSFKTNDQILEQFWLPALPLHVEHYGTAWGAISRYVLNTFVVTGASVVGILVCGSLAAYAFARHRFLGRGPLYFAVLTVLMIPGVLTLIGRFLVVAKLGLLNSHWGLILPYIAADLAFAIFLLRGFMAELPEEYFEAARIDGASELQIYAHVAIPLSTAILSVVGLLAFLSVWNDFVWPLLVLQDRSKFTLMLGLTVFSGESQILYGPLTAGYLLAAIPTAVIILAMRRTFIDGVLAGGLK